MRALCNIREPKPISDEVLKIEDNFLQEELKAKNITDVNNLVFKNEIFAGIQILKNNNTIEKVVFNVFEDEDFEIYKKELILLYFKEE